MLVINNLIKIHPRGAYQAQTRRKPGADQLNCIVCKAVALGRYSMERELLLSSGSYCCKVLFSMAADFDY